VATPFRVRRRAAGGASGAPGSLLQSELAYSEVDQILYVGQGTGGTASVVAIGGPGAYLTSATAGSTYLTISNASSTYLSQASASSTYVTQATASSTYAPLSSPALTGTPTAPTATSGTSSTQIATTAYVSTAISNLVNGAGAALDTLQELAAALGNDASFSTTITTSIGTKADRTLSNLTDAGAARTNLGLGSMATQAANNVAITGGSIDGVTLDGGTF
jgi:hypothetical protein